MTSARRRLLFRAPRSPLPGLRRALFWSLLAGGLFSCAPDGAQSPAPTLFSGPTMGTRYTVKLAQALEVAAVDSVQRAVDRTLARVNRRMSTYLPDSEISRFNRTAGTDWFGVSVETAGVLAEALRTSRLSAGAFDVTVGPLVQLWGFGPAGQRVIRPSPAEVADARGRVGYRLLEVRTAPPGLKRAQNAVEIDLGAIAKGYGVDQVAVTLDSLGLSAYMVEIGGEVRVKGEKAPGQPWQIGIERPVADKRVILRVVSLSDVALATSGDYRIFFEQDGQRYSHTIDPRTGEPIDHDLAAVSVLAGSCMRADALATALLVLGPRDGYELAVREQIAALFVLREGEQLIEKPTPEFGRRYGSME